MHNYQKDKVINESGYELKEGSYIEYTEDGQLKEYFYDENYSIKNDYGNLYSNNLMLIDGGITRSTVIKDGLETVTDYMHHSEWSDYEKNEMRHADNIKIKNIKENSVVNIEGYDLKCGSSIEFDSNGDHLTYIYDENYTVHKEQHGKRTTIEKDGKMCSTIEQSNGKITKIEYEKPIKTDKLAYGGRYGVSGLEYTIEIQYDDQNKIKSIISYKIPEDDGFKFKVNDVNGKVYEISRGSSIYFNSNGTVASYVTDKGDERLEDR